MSEIVPLIFKILNNFGLSTQWNYNALLLTWRPSSSEHSPWKPSLRHCYLCLSLEIILVCISGNSPDPPFQTRFLVKFISLLRRFFSWDRDSLDTHYVYYLKTETLLELILIYSWSIHLCDMRYYWSITLWHEIPIILLVNKSLWYKIPLVDNSLWHG